MGGRVAGGRQEGTERRHGGKARRQRGTKARRKRRRRDGSRRPDVFSPLCLRAFLVDALPSIRILFALPRRIADLANELAPSSRGLGHGPFKAATRVRIPSGSLPLVGECGNAKSLGRRLGDFVFQGRRQKPKK